MSLQSMDTRLPDALQVAREYFRTEAEHLDMASSYR